MLTKTIFRLNFFSKTSLKYFARSFPKKNSSSYQTPIQELNTYEESKIIEDEIFSEKFADPQKTSNGLKSEISPAKAKKDKELVEPIDISKKMDKDKMKFIQDSLLYSGDDPFPEKLVERPEKGVVWGLGGELLKYKENFFKKGVMPTPDEVIAFLELEQGKDITLVDLFKLGRTDINRYGIIVTTFSARHNYKIAKSLLKALNKCEIPHQGSPPRIHGTKNDDWVMVSFKDIGVHLFVQESRDEVNLEWKWKNPVSEEEIYKRERISRSKRKKGVFEPFDS